MAEVPETFTPQPLGKRADIIRQIQEVVPDADFSDPQWGYFGREDFGIEFSMGPDEDVFDFLLSVRGSSTAAYIVADILRHLGLRAYDTWKDDLFDPAEPLPGMQQWQSFVAKVEQHLQDEDKH